MIRTAIVIALVSIPLFAQPKPKPLDTRVTRVNDRRTNGSFSELQIMIDLPSIKSADVAASRVLVSTAIDDLGKSLIDPEANEPQLEANNAGMFGSRPDTPVSVSVTLKNPDRKAVTVKQVAGEIELYMPSKDPNSIAEIPKFLSFSGKAFNHKALKANGVEIALVSAAQIAAEKKRLGEVRRKELAASGYEGEALESSVSSYVDYLYNYEESDVVLRIKDPNQRIQEMNYVDAGGEAKRAMMRADEGFTVVSSWGEKPQPDWKLRISMKTAKNLVRYPFALKDVPLP